MKRTTRSLFGLATLLLAAAASHAQPVDWTPLPAPVSVGHLGAPARIGTQQVLAYELRIANDFRLPLRLDRLELLGPAGDDMPLARYEGQALAALQAQAAPAGAGTAGIALQPGQSTLLYLFLELPAERAWPGALRHRLHWSWERKPGSAERQQSVQTLAAAPTGAPLPALDAPVNGGIWLAANGPANASEHRRTVAYADGVAALPQRYAYDLVLLDAQGRLFRDKGEKPADWFAFGQPLLAAADGVVALAQDGADDNEPVGTVPPAAMNVRSLCGNGLSLRLASGHYLIYCHLKKGSLAVRAGQTVRRGELLGLLGNSGNSDAPHLHLHLSTQAHPMRGEGEPIAFACLRRMGRVPDLEAAFAAGRAELQPGAWVRGQAAGMNELIELPAGTQAACR